MDDTAVTAARAAASKAATGVLSDPRRVVGLLAMAAGAGLILGFYLRGGTPAIDGGLNVPMPGYHGGPIPPEPHRCHECEEKAISDAQAIAAAGAAKAATPSSTTPSSTAPSTAAPTGYDQPAPVASTEPAGPPFSHTDVAPSAATFSPLDVTAPGEPIGVPLEAD